MSTAPSIPELASRLRQHVLQLAHDIGERNVYHPARLQMAEDYIRHSWQDMGFVVKAQEYTAAGVVCANYAVTVPGTRFPDQILLIGAHYDTVAGSPGANDNGSGMASMLELSRLAIADPQPRSLRFVAFANEEPPFFYTERQGSMVYAKQQKQQAEDIRLMLALETMGYYRDEAKSQQYPPLFRFFFPDRANFIGFVSNFKSRRSLRKLTRAFARNSDFPFQQVATFAWVPGVSWSDHLSFWRHGYHAVMVTDTAFYRYPYYHSPQDTAEHLDYHRLAQVTSGLHAALNQLAQQGV